MKSPEVWPETSRGFQLLVLLVALSGIAVGVEPLQQEVPRLGKGDAFPTMWFPDATTGKPRSVQEFRGKPLLVHVYASW